MSLPQTLLKAGCTHAVNLMAASRSTGVKLDHGKVGVAFVAMKELDGDQQHGRKLSTQNHLVSSSLLQLMQSNAPARIASIRPQLLQSCNIKKHDTVELQLITVRVLERHIPGRYT